jgi:ABC-2 type transport system permease protein
MTPRVPSPRESFSAQAALQAAQWKPPAGWQRVRRDAQSLRDLFFIQFAAIRTGWQWYFLVSSIIPLGMLYFLSYAANTADPAIPMYYITGSMVVALVFNSMSMLAGQLASFRQYRLFDFYAGLPVSRTGVILATVAVSALLALPGMLLMLVFGTLIYHIVLSPSALVVIVMLVGPLTLCGVGALIGVLSPNQQVAGVLANLALVVVMFLSPVLAPSSELPGFLRITSVLMPPTYVADALRRTLQGQVNATVFVDIAVMALFALGSIYLVTTRLDWRSR